MYIFVHVIPELLNIKVKPTHLNHLLFHKNGHQFLCANHTKEAKHFIKFETFIKENQ